MTEGRKITIRTTRHDDVMGGTAVIEWEAIQPINKDGRDSKRPARKTGAYTIRWADGSFRTYSRNPQTGSVCLSEEKITPERLKAERQ